MKKYAEIDSRMKHNYEEVTKYRLMRRTPVAIRIDGRAFHTLTKGFKKPFDDILRDSMNETMLYLCENIQGCVFGYTQSDEITLILVDYQSLVSDAWFDYKVQKLCSITASMATMKFNELFQRKVDDAREFSHVASDSENPVKYQYETHKGIKQAMFDSRCFNIPKEEVCNLIFSRQLDCERNALQIIGREYFSDKELDKKSVSDIKEMLLKEKGVDWKSFDRKYVYGVACKRENGGSFELDFDVPKFKGEDRAYIEDLVFVGE